MSAQCQESCERVGPTPPVVDSVPNGATISDDESMDSSVCSQHSEPTGEFRDDNDGFVHIPQPLPAPNIIYEGAGPNIIPVGDSLLHPILVQGLVSVPTNILLLNGFVVLMESWNLLISVSLNSRMLWGNSTKIYLLLHLEQGRYLHMLRQCQRKRRD
jgi:hypothetical protein